MTEVSDNVSRDVTAIYVPTDECETDHVSAVM
jgi:hypothetical protein